MFFMKKLFIAFVVGIVIGLLVAWLYIPKPF